MNTVACKPNKQANKYVRKISLNEYQYKKTIIVKIGKKILAKANIKGSIFARVFFDLKVEQNFEINKEKGFCNGSY